MDSSTRQYLDDVPRDIQDLIYEGKKLEAAKLQRRYSSMSLNEAVNQVEVWRARMIEKFPGEVPDEDPQGCAKAMVWFAFLALFAFAMFVWMYFTRGRGR